MAVGLALARASGVQSLPRRSSRERAAADQRRTRARSPHPATPPEPRRVQQRSARAAGLAAHVSARLRRVADAAEVDHTGVGRMGNTSVALRTLSLVWFASVMACEGTRSEMRGGADAAPGPAASPSGVRVPACDDGVVAECDSARCAPGRRCVTCPPGELCVEVKTACGPVSAATAQCVRDPCAGSELSCDCASSICQAAGSLSCSTFGQSHFLVGATRRPFLACTSGAPSP